MSIYAIQSFKNPARRWILIGIPGLFIIGSLMHFLYNWSGKLAWVGIFAPVNESVWEHLKLVFWPMLIWWFAGYLIYGKKNGTSFTQWLVPCTAAQVVCPAVILSFYYTYTGALGIKSIILDIFSLLLGLSIAQGIAVHVYRYAKFNNYWLFSCLTMLVLMAAAYTFFTFAAPGIPLFKVS